MARTARGSTGPDRSRTVVAAADPMLAAFIDRAGPYEPRPGEGDPFTSLARAIVFQQLAGRAAAAIYGRFAATIGGTVSAEAILATAPEQLRAAGLSGNKTTSLIDLATKVRDGTVPLDGIEALDDDEIVARLTMVRGIGRWTAEMFLLFELRRPDVWPVDDLGVRNGWSLIHDLPEMIKPRALEAEGDRFRPHRSTVALYCWHAVHVDRGQVSPRPVARAEPRPPSRRSSRSGT
ncbi:MAG TPA: DNA-3-methyladenine glycosylase 2 family protein [Patescibacteria group bacterium]|nr:DNA-3-methyladenine glycosylase 2 family protein [Patescibacteria group bacterium]